MNALPVHRCVLLTGATGFLGAQIARRLLRESDLTIITLVRAQDQAAAAQRLARAWWDWPDLRQALPAARTLNGGRGEPFPPQAEHNARVEVFAGDVSHPNLGLDEATYAGLAARITHIIHTAADLRLDAPLAELRKTNVQGTANIIALARLVHRDHDLARYAHVSTAYVAGARNGAIPEADLTEEFGFSNGYERSKYEGERLVQAARSELPISIFHPGMIVGAAETGEIRAFNTFYYPLRLYLTARLPLIPAAAGLRVNIVPVDYAAETVVRLTFCPEAQGLNFHLTAPAASLPTVRELVEFTRAWAREHLGLRLPRPVFVRLQLPQKRFRLDHAVGHLSPSSRRAGFGSELKNLIAYLPYFSEHKQFQRDNVDRLLGAYPLNWRTFLPALLAYAVDQGFLYRTERTVHEQLLARLGSKSRPVSYFDVVDGKPVPRSAAEVRAEILAAAAALTALGIRPGERVAIVGLNSTRYLALDAAIGLLGAVSVPLYYTSPAADIDAILSASGARLLLVGAPKILDAVDAIHADLPVVSFCRGSIPAELGRPVMAWEAFLALGAGISVPQHAPVGFGDLATLRYTSGTTGQPKGVSFQHQHLRWMGQTMASLLPWKTRNRTADYLSFLPMNHVVEGILATYSPYYLPAAVNIYFLEDLKDIQKVLPRVRPMIFFSVPRIYEKIWEALERNPLGRRYLNLPDGLFKRILRGLLRRQTLKKAGLDRCDQLIAGSAPCGEGLLQNFRELGVEIHNAYGLTEAPLLTLNRPGANRLGTVGEPLPQTELRIAEDGEVLARGPQVMAGYFADPAGEKAQQPFRDGWLLTGDLGTFAPDGSLVLKGRKKELFKTSYGKYVQPAKIESRLREIPGVTEAMLVGEQRPYCVALLWIQEDTLDEAAEQRIDRLVTEVNSGLSHPERVKRWAVLTNDLSIEAGELTANLKLKRQVIAGQLKGVLDSLYGGVVPPAAVLHIGMARKG